MERLLQTSWMPYSCTHIQTRCLPPPNGPGQLGEDGEAIADESDALFLDRESGDCFEPDFTAGKYR